ncbi:ribonuclease, partial [Xanthomonas hortorum pv. gardneri]
MRLPSRAVSLSCVLPLACAFALAVPTAHAAVFINELHYDDAGASGDSGEGVEVVATAGESLSGYRIYLYNGSAPSAATVYANTAGPAGSLGSCGSQAGVATVRYASNG